MSRLRRYCPPGLPAHVIQRGNNRSDCFVCDLDKATFINYLSDASRRYDVDVHAWVLMSNHVHLLVTPNVADGVSKMVQHIGRDYVRYFNKKYSRTGTLWEGRFRSCLVQTESYFLTCQRYIELNPVRANLVNRPVDYHWSSFRSNAMGVNSDLICPHPVYMALGKSCAERLREYRNLFDTEMPAESIAKIRNAVNKGLVLGTESFIQRVETESGQRGRLLKTGPKGPRNNNFCSEPKLDRAVKEQFLL